MILRSPDCGNRRTEYTASMGASVSFGIGPLSMSLQASVVTDSSGRSELQIAYSTPNIFSTSLPSVDEMFANIAADTSKFTFGVSATMNMSFTNAPSVTDLHGPTYSVGVSGPGIAIDYNAIPDSENPNNVYSGITFSSGVTTPGFNVSMSNTVYTVPISISVFDIANHMYNSLWGIY